GEELHHVVGLGERLQVDLDAGEVLELAELSLHGVRERVLAHEQVQFGALEVAPVELVDFGRRALVAAAGASCDEYRRRQDCPDAQYAASRAIRCVEQGDDLLRSVPLLCGAWPARATQPHCGVTARLGEYRAHMSTLRIDQQVAHVYVALQNLAEGRAISEIAAEIGVSRFTAARMVKRARELGLVEVRAVVNDPVDVELSARLAQRYGLQSALVVACPSSGDAEVREALAEVAAKFLVDHAQEDEVLGLTPGRTSVALSRRVEELPSLDVVQTTGVGDPNLANGVEAILNIGRASGG